MLDKEDVEDLGRLTPTWMEAAEKQVVEWSTKGANLGNRLFETNCGALGGKVRYGLRNTENRPIGSSCRN